jgi:type I restriction enzyme M protein
MTSGEGAIREALIRDDLVDCIVALPARLFYTTGIPVCLWFLDRNKTTDGERHRKGESLFIDARDLGQKISSTQIELTASEVAKIVGTYHRWRGTLEGDYVDEPGFCKSASLDEVEAAGFALSPGRYVGIAETEEDEVEFDERIATLTERLSLELAENERLAGAVRTALARAGHEL